MGRQSHGGREGVVDDEREPVAARERGQPLQVEDAAAWVAHGLAIQQARARGDGRLPRIEVVRIDEPGRHRQLAERVHELRDGAAVEVRRADDLVAGLQHGHQCHQLGRHAARGGERARRALERGHALLECRGGRVADPRVDVAVLLELEQQRRLLRAVEDEARGLVDRHGSRPDLGIGNVTGVEHARLEAESARVGVGHRVSG
jgi:hypothetical protein